MQHAEDKEIIESFLKREHQAVQLIESWIARAASPFRQRLGEDWEDTLQEARLEIGRLLERGSFRGESSLKTYLWRVTNHACLRRIRVLKRVEWVDIDSLAEERLPQTDSPLDQMLERESSLIALRVLEELSEECRRMLQLIVAGTSYQEMSRQLQLAEGTLRVRVLRCRKRAVELRDRWLGKLEKKDQTTL